MTPTGRLALSSTERVVDGVHRHTSDRRTLVLPAIPPGLSEGDELGLGVAHFADGRPTVDRDHPHLAGRQSQCGVLAFFGDDLDRGSGRASHLAARARLELDVVNHSTDWDVSQGKAGRNRWRNKRPSVRGVAMNPVDHPLGGGEGKTSGGRHPVSPWGKPEGRTRKRKASDSQIIRRRKSGKNKR